MVMQRFMIAPGSRPLLDRRGHKNAVVRIVKTAAEPAPGCRAGSR